ncbi:helix-turn-helix transcriptional regulator [Acetobacter orientalis]|uniref:helix-turn-helix transcriptional regulator n=1 Tax=Acetobacter orientalis TaxID=146474 RepID=UPI0039EA6386
MSTNTSSDGRLVHFPGKTVLSRQEAMHYLGVSRMAFLALRTLRCTPRPRQLDGRSVYREEELERFKTGLLQAVGVQSSTSFYRRIMPPAAILPKVNSTPETDPLMQLLAYATIRHRLILLILWSMVCFGSLCTLILF